MVVIPAWYSSSVLAAPFHHTRRQLSSPNSVNVTSVGRRRQIFVRVFLIKTIPPLTTTTTTTTGGTQQRVHHATVHLTLRIHPATIQLPATRPTLIKPTATTPGTRPPPCSPPGNRFLVFQRGHCRRSAPPGRPVTMTILVTPSDSDTM